MARSLCLVSTKADGRKQYVTGYYNTEARVKFSSNGLRAKMFQTVEEAREYQTRYCTGHETSIEVWGSVGGGAS